MRQSARSLYIDSYLILLNQDIMKLALGTVQFGLPYGIANKKGQVRRSEAAEMLRLSIDNGIDTIDTAIAYGESEACLGAIGIDGFKIVTKLPAIPEGCLSIGAWIQEQFAASLARLGKKTIYGFLLHSPEQLFGVGGMEIYKTLNDLKKKGQVQKIGVSIYDPQELESITKHVSLDLVQAPFNLIDQRLLTSGWLKKLKKEGVEVHTRSVFLQGLLLMSKNSRPIYFEPWRDLFEKWHNWLAKNNVSAVKACIEYPLQISEIDRVVVGADSIDQLSEIIHFINNKSLLSFPSLNCNDERLINPFYWSS